MLGIRWPKVIKNTELYKKTDAEKWSIIVKKRRLSWLGHLLRLDDETPAKKALKEYFRKVKKRRGKRKTTWIDIIKKDFQHLNFTDESKLLQHLGTLSGNRRLWKSLIQHIMLNITNM